MVAKSEYKIVVSSTGFSDALAKSGNLTTTLGDLNASLNQFSSASKLAAGAIAKAGAEYENSLNKVATLATDATGDSEALTTQFLKLSDTLKGGIAITDAAAASYDILSTGFSKQADVLGILEGSQKTAIGGYSDLNKISGVTAKFLQVYSGELSGLGDVTAQVKYLQDQMIQTQNLGVITVDQYADGIGNLISTAQASGVSITELNAAIAQATAVGGPASSVMTDLAQLLSNIANPSQQAARAASDLGLEFGPLALKGKGLAGVMADIQEKAGGNDALLRKLFGSTEAFRTAMTLLGTNTDAFRQKLDAMGNSVGLRDAAFNQMSEGTLVKFDAAMNRSKNSLALLGNASKESLIPVINAMSGLFEAVSELDPQILKIAGTATVAAGGLGVLGGGVAGLALSLGALEKVLGLSAIRLGLWKALTTSINLTTLVSTVQAFSLAQVQANLQLALLDVRAKAAALSTVGFNAALGTTVTGLGAVAVALGAVTVAVGGLVLAWKNYENLKLEEDSERTAQQLRATEKAAQDLSTTVLKMKATGKALPVEEFEKLKKKLEILDGGTGTLTKQTAALVKVQGDLTQKAKSAAGAHKEAAEGARIQTDSYRVLSDQARDLIAAAESQKRVDDARANSLGSELERTRALAKSQETYSRAVISAHNRVKESNDATQYEIARTEADIAEQQAAIVKAKAGVILATETELANKRRALLDKELAEAKTRAANKGADPNTDAGVEAATRKRAQAEEALLRQAIKRTKEGTAERAEAEKALSQAIAAESERRFTLVRAAELKETQERDKANRERLQSTKKADQERTKAERERTQAAKKADQERVEAARQALNQELADLKTHNAQVVEELANRKSLLEDASTGLSQNASLTGVAGSGLESINAVLERRKSLQEQLKQSQASEKVDTEQIARLNAEIAATTEQEVRAKRALGVIQGALQSVGVEINTQGTIEQQVANATLAIERTKLTLKQQQLQIAQEIQRAETESQLAQARAERDVATVKQGSDTLSQKDRLQAGLEVQQADIKIRGLERAQAIKERGFLLAQKELDIEKAIAEIKLGGRGGSGSGSTNTPSPAAPRTLANTPGNVIPKDWLPDPAATNAANQKAPVTLASIDSKATPLAHLNTFKPALDRVGGEVLKLNSTMGALLPSVAKDTSAIRAILTGVSNSLQGIRGDVKGLQSAIYSSGARAR